MQSATWFRISLTSAQVAEGHVDRIQDTFAELLIDASAPPGAAMFGMARDDGVDLYFTPPAARVAEELLKENGAAPCLPPINEGDITLMVGEKTDQRLLSS